MLITSRKIVGLLAVFALLAAGLLTSAVVDAPGASAKPKKAKPKKTKPKKTKPKYKVQVNIVDAGQNPMRKRGVLKVKVRAKRKGKLRVRGFSSTFDGKDVMKPLTKVAWPKFKRAGQWRTIKLKVTAGSRTQATSCQNRDIQVKAGTVLSRPKSMVRQSADCKPGTVDLSRAADCDFIAAQDPAICMSPFPDNYYTVADETTVSGRRINFTAAAMPANKNGERVDPAPYRASDGFSQGQVISVRVPGLDNPTALAQTNPVGLADPSRYALPNTPVIVINALTRERIPIWVEIDSQASSPNTTNLLIHPMVNFDAATRYIVALRNLKDAAGTVLKAPSGFRYYRDFLPSTDSRINGRRSSFEDMFKRLRAAGVRRSSLYLAWDFTTASDENNTERALSMRNQAFAGLGDTKLADRVIQGNAPDFTVSSVETDVNAEIARRVKGAFEVPCFMKHPSMASGCASGGTLNLDGDGVPRQNGTYQANFECVIPRVNVDPDSIDPTELPGASLRGRAMVYGHGLMGSIGGEVNAGAQRKTAARGFTICGTDEIGMSTGDIATVVAALANLSKFPQVADRLQQGLLNEMFLARLMIHPQGLVSKAAFRFDPDAVGPVEVPGGDGNADVPDSSTLGAAIVTGQNVRAWYRGISQGGIMGGALMALAPDFDKGSLGVGAMNYSVLLTRSGSWGTYGAIFNPAYTNQTQRPLALSLVQMLWDRGEPNGYAHRMTTSPLADTPPHQVLFDLAFGDHLVTNWQSNVEARTIGARAVTPFVAEGRWPGVDGDWGIEPITSFPYNGSAIAYWDSGPLRSGGTLGTNPPPITNTAPAEGQDPHELPRVSDTAVKMIDGFLREGGAVTNPCAPGPCLAGGWTGS
ncbi:MAG: hypothetical protein BGO23_05495 [Solirubrobacterales bacterium 67-14]|nr:MAG: hypothetical protein BGO23_05495 [Solirubrobacterales bacterium 67-14]